MANQSKFQAMRQEQETGCVEIDQSPSKEAGLGEGCYAAGNTRVTYCSHFIHTPDFMCAKEMHSPLSAGGCGGEDRT
jgi:hypothetical protein